MDLEEEWELLPDGNTYESSGKSFLSKLELLQMIDMDYFLCPSEPQQTVLADQSPPIRQQKEYVKIEEREDGSEESKESSEAAEKERTQQQQQQAPAMDQIRSGANEFWIRIWRWRESGLGALCSIGAAAAATATIWLLVLGTRRQQQQQKGRFQLIYPGDGGQEGERMRRAVVQQHQASCRLKQQHQLAVRRARISFGGYYHGL